MNIICYGDSNTWGYDPRDPLGGQYDKSWPELLAEVSGWHVRNLGENGREVPTHSVAFPADCTLILIMLGTNDLLQSGIPEAVCRKMEQFLCSVDMEMRRILLIAPPPMAYGEWVQDAALIDRSAFLANCYQDLAARLGTGFADAGEWHIPLAFDGVHFTQEGHRIFAEHLFRFLKENLLPICYFPRNKP